MNKLKEKISYQDVGWIDRFNDDFKFIRGAVDLTAAGLGYDAPVQPISVSHVMEEALSKLEQLNDLIQGVWGSIRSTQQSNPETKKKKEIWNQGTKEFVMATKRIGEKTDRKLKALKRRTS